MVANSVTSVEIAEGTRGITDYVFYYCESLTNVKIPNSLIHIGEKAFYNCNTLKDIDFDGTREQWNAITKGDDWNSYTGNYVVRCTDGDINK